MVLQDEHLLAPRSGRRLCFAGNAEVVFHAGDLAQFAHLLLLCTILNPLDIDGAVFLRSFVQPLHLPASLDSTGITPLLRYYGGSVTSREQFFGPSTGHERCSLSRFVIPDSYRSNFRPFYLQPPYAFLSAAHCALQR
jgi:hypothetical protein